MNKRAQNRTARLVVAGSTTDADMLYASGFLVPDPFIFLEWRGKRTVVLSDLEFDRGVRESSADEVVSYSEIEAGLAKKTKGAAALSFGEILAGFLAGRGIAAVEVPANFPLGLARGLERAGISPAPVAGHFWPEREIKSPADIKEISRALRVTEAGMEAAFGILAASRIRRDRKLEWGGATLTSQRLRAEIESTVLHAGGFCAGDTIVACGGAACDPHERGAGPLRADELIILDVFPRIARSGYYGDLTRTVVRGRASDGQRRLWETCLEGQRRAIRGVKPGVDGGSLQDAVRQYFTESGYPTQRERGRWTGFFHGLGHGLGLELHEEPRIARTTFRAGQVFTVEPGIYVPGVGGVRHEDVVAVTAAGCRTLSKFPKPLEL